MSRRVSLKEFQEGLASRLKAAAAGPAPSARLAFEAGGGYWLTPLDRSGEVMQVPEIQRVPLTQDWFLGVVNVRGALYGVSDFGAFLGGPPTGRAPENRLLLVGRPMDMNCALLVSRLAGLRSVANFTPEPATAVWSTAAWRDKDGRLWHELDTARLLAHRDFLEIAVH